MKKVNKRKIRVVELFAGVGGFRLGLEEGEKKFKVIYANQWEPGRKKQWAFECYTHHYGKSDSHTNEDIAKVKHEIVEHDLLVGGFPCQDYSVAHGNKGEGIKGKKGVLWWEIRDIIENTKPPFILLENVDRLLKSPTKQRGRDFGIMLKTLFDLDYNVEWRVINAAEYGFAQRRRRVFIFAYSKELLSQLFELTDDFKLFIKKKGFFGDTFKISGINDRKKPTCIDLKELNYDDLADFSDNFSAQFRNAGLMIDGKIFSIDVLPQIIKGTPLSAIIEKGPVDEQFFINGAHDKLNYLKSRKKIKRVNPIGQEYFYSEGQMSFPDDINLPARTMLTSESSTNRSTHVIQDYITKRLRYLTPLEAERINGFKDNWTDTGMPIKFRYFCMGNALVVPLITMMGKKISKLWGKLNG